MTAVPPALAAPVVVTPTYPAFVEGVTPPLAVNGITTYKLDSLDGSAVSTVDGAQNIVNWDQPPTGQTAVASFMSPPDGSGMVLPPGYAGSFTEAVSESTPGSAPSDTTVAIDTAWRTAAGTLSGATWAASPPPPGLVGPSHSITHDSFAWSGPNAVSFRRDFDFSGLAGGALPAGTLLAFTDIDVCNPHREYSTLDADATGDWLEYYTVTGGVPATVRFDAAASATWSPRHAGTPVRRISGFAPSSPSPH